MDQFSQQQKYVCPMHPEVVSDTPGRCPKCGMKLVPEGTAPLRTHADRGLGPRTWKNYLPLAVVIGLITIVSLLAASKTATFSTSFFTYFMAGFFVVFAGFKLIDLKGFAEGYSVYDILAKRVYAYGYAYPFIELFFGLAMIVGIFMIPLLWAEFAVMAFSGLGVALQLAKGEEFHCVCLGTFLKVPLTYITLVEDFGMAILALLLIFLM